MQYMGAQFDKDHIATVAKEVQRRSAERKDFIADRAKMRVVQVDKQAHLKLDVLDTLMPFRRPSFRQLATTLNVPGRYLDRLESAGHLDLAIHNLNTIMERESKRHLVRTLDGRVDAVLSDRYRALDNLDVLAIALQEIKRVGAEVWDLRLTDDQFRILAVAPQISGQVSTDRTFDPGDGWRSRWYGNEGDVLNAAVTISNSETGHGGLHVSPSILRRVCANFCVWGDGIAQVHLGKKQDADGEVFYSDETKRKEDEVIWMKVRDMVSGTFTAERFQAILDRINETTQTAIEKPTEAVDAACRNLLLPLEYKEAILESLLQSGDKSHFGLCQAITEQANPKKGAKADDATRSMLEDAGGKVLQMSKSQFTKLIEA